MTFLQPALLFLLFSVLIPLIIHLTGERNYLKQPFPDLRFLRELKGDSLQKIRLRQWFVLLLRMLWMLCLILALARPFFSGHFRPGVGMEDAGIILCDRSESMQIGIDGDAAAAILKTAFPRYKTLYFDGRPDSVAAMEASILAYIREKRSTHIPLIFFSDFQGNDVNRSLAGFLSKQAALSPRIRLKAGRNGDNAAIRSLHLSRDVRNDGNLLTLSVQISSNTSAMSYYSVYATLDGQSETRILIGENGVGEYRFAPLGNKQDLKASVSLDGDDFNVDNTRYFIIPADRPYQILLLREEGRKSYLPAALKSMSGFSVSIRYISELASLSLSPYDLIIVEDSGNINPSQGRRLLDFARNAPLLCIPLSTQLSASFNPSGQILQQAADAGHEGFVTLDSVDVSFRSPQFHAGSFRINSYFRSTETGIHPVWILSNGDPLLYRRSGTKIYFLLSPFDFDHNRLGLNPRFLPSMKALFLGMRGDWTEKMETGMPIYARNGGLFSVTRPDGIREKADGIYSGTSLPGIYRIEEGGQEQMIAVNLPERECVMTGLALSDSSQSSIPWNSESISRITDILKGRDAAGLFILLAALFFLAELLLLILNKRGLI